MLQKKCGRCHRTIPVGSKCPYCKPDYAPATGVKKKYHTSRWTKLAKLIMARYNGLDQYQLVYEHRIMQAETVHHIIPTKDDESKFFDENNLVLLSEYTHRQVVHKAYNSSDEEKEAMIAKLRQLVKEVEV